MKLPARQKVFSLLVWPALVVVLAGTAYVSGSVLARRWMTPSLALPPPTATAQPQPAPAAPIGPDQPAEGTLDADSFDEWHFDGQAGQSATIEMWFHPGSGSSVEAELMVRLIAPSGETLAEKRGNVFLPPYLAARSLPATGDYHLRVLPLAGSPGRYSLSLALSDDPAHAEVGDTRPRPTISAPDDPQASSLTRFQWPSSRRGISGWTFHDPGNPGHIGLDIDAEVWDPILAAEDGEVTFAAWGGGYGNLVIVEHEGGWSSYYAHLTEIGVDEGDDVQQGQTLGAAGTTGFSTGPHLHFELRYKGRPVDPHVHLP